MPEKLPVVTPGPAGHQLSGGAYMEHLMKKGEYGQLSEGEVKVLQKDFHFKPEAFEPVTTSQGTTWKLVPVPAPRKLGLTIVGNPFSEMADEMERDE